MSQIKGESIKSIRYDGVFSKTSLIPEFLLWPIKKYRLIVNNMHSQDPREKTWAMYEVASIFLCPYGLDIFELDYKQSARTWIIGLVLFDVNLFALYSAIYYCYKQEPMLVLQAMTTYGITIPVSIKHHLFFVTI